MHQVREKTSLQIAKLKQTFSIDFCLKVLYRHRTSKVKKKKTDEDLRSGRNIAVYKWKFKHTGDQTYRLFPVHLRRSWASSSAPASSKHTGASFSTIFKVNFHLLLTRLAGYFSMRLK